MTPISHLKLVVIIAFSLSSLISFFLLGDIMNTTLTLSGKVIASFFGGILIIPFALWATGWKWEN